MRVRVTGVKTVGLQSNAMGPTASNLYVSAVSVLATTATPRGLASTTTAPLVGSAPSAMGVLFVIVTMCSQAASITPTVRCESQTVTCHLCAVSSVCRCPKTRAHESSCSQPPSITFLGGWVPRG
jgi:hypothetical protein